MFKTLSILAVMATISLYGIHAVAQGASVDTSLSTGTNIGLGGNSITTDTGTTANTGIASDSQNSVNASGNVDAGIGLNGTTIGVGTNTNSSVQGNTSPNYYSGSRRGSSSYNSRLSTDNTIDIH